MVDEVLPGRGPVVDDACNLAQLVEASHNLIISHCIEVELDDVVEQIRDETETLLDVPRNPCVLRLVEVIEQMTVSSEGSQTTDEVLEELVVAVDDLEELLDDTLLGRADEVPVGQELANDESNSLKGELVLCSSSVDDKLQGEDFSKDELQFLVLKDRENVVHVVRGDSRQKKATTVVLRRDEVLPLEGLSVLTERLRLGETSRWESLTLFDREPWRSCFRGRR